MPFEPMFFNLLINVQIFRSRLTTEVLPKTNIKVEVKRFPHHIFLICDVSYLFFASDAITQYLTEDRLCGSLTPNNVEGKRNLQVDLMHLSTKGYCTVLIGSWI